MKAPRARSVSRKFFLHSVDRLGRPIDAVVLAAAYELGPRAIGYAERLLGDEALTIDLLEEAAAAVSEALRKKRKQGKGPVRNLTSYLFRSYLRKIGQVRGKQNRLDASLRGQTLAAKGTRGWKAAELALLVDEVLAIYDKLTLQIIHGHIEGYSWNEIGSELGLTPHAAEMRYSRALAKARKLLAKRLSKP
jgi:DNA-directed RNA polymerase specialized sigma24 family protein